MIEKHGQNAFAKDCRIVLTSKHGMQRFPRNNPSAELTPCPPTPLQARRRDCHRPGAAEEAGQVPLPTPAHSHTAPKAACSTANLLERRIPVDARRDVET